MTGLGKYIYAIPMLVFGVFHFMGANDMAGMAPFGGVTTIYIVGLCLILAAVSIFIGKYDKLATVLLALMLFLFAFIMWFSGFTAQEQPATSMFLKDLGLAGAALMYAHSSSRDNAIIG
ncbi:MAG: DoxX family protein [Saprospiraceae bacterium]|nr:DoxX family protein [Saprospiraceae bacterium]